MPQNPRRAPAAQPTAPTQQGLTAQQCEAAPLTHGNAIKKLSDGGGLFLQIDSRSKGWRLRYRFNGKDSLMSLGVYPTVSLEKARTLAKDARAKLERGESPADARRKERDDAWLQAAKTFGVVAAEYNASQLHTSAKTQERHRRLYGHARKLHSRTFAQIERPDILTVCRTLEGVGKRETAHRLGIYVSQVFRFARDNGYFKGVDPTAGGFGKSLSPVRTVNRPALTESRAVGGLMRNIDSGEFLMMGATVTRALQLLARTAVRPGELANAEWSEVDLTGQRHNGKPTWVIPLHRMKMRDANRSNHVVPLSRQAVAILEAQQTLTGDGKYIFPNSRSAARPMSDAAMSAALIGLGYRDQHCPHGFRATFKTLAHDVLKAESELVERQLAHRVGSEVARAYDRSQRLEERRKLMQDYSDLLDKLT
jgi:integrase